MENNLKRIKAFLAHGQTRVDVPYLDQQRVYGEGMLRVGTCLALEEDMYTLLFITCLKLSELQKYVDLSDHDFKPKFAAKEESQEPEKSESDKKDIPANKMLQRIKENLKLKFEQKMFLERHMWNEVETANLKS